MKITVISNETSTLQSVGKHCVLIQRIRVLEQFIQDALDYQSSTNQEPVIMEEESSSDEEDLP